MGNCIVKLLAYSVILPISENPELNILEIAVLRYLKAGKSREFISEKLGIPIERPIAELKYKGIIGPDMSFRYKSIEDWYVFSKKAYKKGYVFYHTEEKNFFNALVLSHEIKLNNNFTLANNLGNCYILWNVLEGMSIVKTFEIFYDIPDTKEAPTRKIINSPLEYLHYVHEGD